MRKLHLLGALAICFLAGCFPIELDVRDGKVLIPREEGFFIYDTATGKVEKIADNSGGKPVFARYSPDGKEILTVVKTKGGFDDLFVFTIISRSGGQGREIHKAANCAYAAFSPDGTKLAVIQSSAKDIEKFKSKMPELWIVSLDGKGPSKKLADFTGARCRWMPDSQKLITLQVDEKDKDNNFIGHMISVDLDGKATKLGSAITSQTMHFDVAPSGKKALVTAYGVAKAGEQPVKEKNAYAMKLYELDVASTTWRKIDKQVHYAFYSPDGKHVLLGAEPEGFEFVKTDITIADADFKTFTKIAPGAAMPMAIGGEGKLYAGWLNDKSAFYFMEKAVYGTEGKSLNLMTIGIDGKGAKNVQPQIEFEIAK
jgi:dipeptidyl aminopeptidase/acylaminoacyl peptidase